MRRVYFYIIISLIITATVAGIYFNKKQRVVLPSPTPVVSASPTTSVEVDLPGKTPWPLPAISGSPAPTSSIQYVIFSFDGSRDLNMWEATRQFAREQAGRGAPVHFTYFISGVYFLDYAHRMEYQGPGQSVGYSPIGWADNAKDIERRVTEVKQAVAEGHEIGSHANGHFSGSNWTADQWRSELDQFNKFVGSAFSTYDTSSSAYPVIRGFRAPLLANDSSMYQVLTSDHYGYDVSMHTIRPVQPYKMANGIWEFPLPQIPYHTNPKYRLISMDYNFYFYQTSAKDLAKKGTPLWNQIYDQTLQTYRDYFYEQYHGKHIPVLISDHFSLWNDGVYWETVKALAGETCGLPGVKCVTFSEYLNSINH